MTRDEHVLEYGLDPEVYREFLDTKEYDLLRRKRR